MCYGNVLNTNQKATLVNFHHDLVIKTISAAAGAVLQRARSTYTFVKLLMMNQMVTMPIRTLPSPKGHPRGILLLDGPEGGERVGFFIITPNPP